MYCPNCGKIFQAGFTVCEFCGEPLDNRDEIDREQAKMYSFFGIKQTPLGDSKTGYKEIRR